MAGISESNISGDKTENSNGLNDYWLVHIDSLGDIEAQSSIGGGSDDRLHSISSATFGSYVFGGRSWSGVSGDKTEDSEGLYDYWVVKLSPSSRITGKIFIDLNQNNIQDNGEANISGVKVTESSTGRYSYSQSDGSYSIGVFDSASYTVSPANTINYYASTPPTHTTTFTTTKQINTKKGIAEREERAREIKTKILEHENK